MARTQQAQQLCNTQWGTQPGGGWGLRHRHWTLPLLLASFLLCSASSQAVADHCHHTLPAAGAVPSKEQRAARPLQVELCAPVCLLSLASHSKNRGLEVASCSARSCLLKCRKLAGDAALLHSKSFPMALITQRSREFKINFITQHILMA